MTQIQTLLLADDEPHILLALEYMSRTLKDVKVYTASDGPMAVKLAIEQLPHLVLMDVMMPGIDGYTACATIRKSWEEQGHHGHIWFITARSSNMDNEHALSVGADRVVHKPFDPDALLKMMNEHFATSDTTA
jgi:two-component system alkaline phosphatase synthesis response regulator PhoP